MADSSRKAVPGPQFNHKVLRMGQGTSPLVFLLHGRTGDLESMKPFLKIIPKDCTVISLQGAFKDPLGGYSWWKVDERNFRIDRPVEDALLPLSYMNDLMKDYELSPHTKVALGFSQGAGIVSLIFQIEPSYFDGITFLSGFVTKLPVLHESELIQKIFAGIGPRVFWAHGQRDPVIAVERARADFEWLESLGLEGKFVQDDVEHKVGPDGMHELKKWLGDF